MSENLIFHRVCNLSQEHRKILVNLLNQRKTKQQPAGTRQLVAYVTATDQLDLEKLKAYISQNLPDFMIPGFIVQLDQLPKVPNGKVNYSKLPAINKRKTQDQGEKYRVAGEIEEILTTIWEEVLGIEPVEISDNFFEIGGDSILSIQIVAKAKKKGLIITAEQLFSYQTIEELSRQVKVTEKTTGPDKDVMPHLDISPTDLHSLFKQLNIRPDEDK